MIVYPLMRTHNVVYVTFATTNYTMRQLTTKVQHNGNPFYSGF